ncbi:hypothetical protein INT47_008622 [Mucor saturninus]|uniref:RRM domain-containing protein n=1 Tax=Mucor saturninus TaxID=64648 RepID=A0A8H7V066_9FUNG|nr:hypothetical protein INT47_008622 [Mucor saturninus]
MNKPLPIKPPRSMKKQPVRNPTYSLFDTMTPSLDWLNTSKRKHSFSSSLKDVTSTDHKDEGPGGGFWRRASLPNYFTSVKQDCDHSMLNVCQDCITKVSSPSSFTTFDLPKEPSFTIPPFLDSFSPCSSFIYPDEAFFIGDLLSPSTSLDSFPDLNTFYCIKITNIPWDISQKDIRLFFKDFEFPSPSLHAQSIHIMMDRMTGKTLSCCYLEFMTEREAQRAMDYGNQRMLKNRLVTIHRCSSAEFLTTTFPKWQSGFMGHRANEPTQSVFQPFVTSEEMNSILVICKNYKLHFSRKCAERPFENIISIVTKYPWENEWVTVVQKDAIFDMLKSSMDILKCHLAKEVVHIDDSLLHRMARVGIMCPAFTEPQKASLLQTAHIKCPMMDIESYMLKSRPLPLDHSYVHVTTANTSLLDILNASPSASRNESDEESYFFCEKEDDEESFCQLQLVQ